jgi:hypothetical protein
MGVSMSGPLTSTHLRLRDLMAASRSAPDALRVHAALGPSAEALGFPAGVRCPPERPLRHRAAAVDT